jgi:hypothetical protein
MNRGSTRYSLSSKSTLFSKFILAICIGSLGIGTIRSLLSEPQETGWFILALFVFIILSWNFFQIKSVEIDSRYLYISNFIKTIRIPFSNIEDVTESSIINYHPVWIRFKKNTEFGKEIVFMPYYHFWASLPFMSHPVVAKLRGLAGLQVDE